MKTTEGFWSTVREALRGNEHDYTTLELNRAILLLAVPMVLEMLMESLFAVVDIYFVSGLGTDAIAAVALTESVVTILYAVAIGLSMATTAMVARRVGEQDTPGATSAAVQAIYIGAGLSLLTALGGVMFAPELLRLMGGNDQVIAAGTNFTRLILGGSVTIFLLFLNNAIFRGAGDAAIAMRALWIGNGVNIVLNPCLILGLGPFPELGLVGSAAGTTIGRGCGVLYQFWVLASGRSRIRVMANQAALRLDVLWRLLRVSLTGIVQFLVSTSSWLGLVRIIVFAILPSWGLCNAAATLVGQNLGARKPERAERAVYRAGWYNMAFLGAVAVVFITFASPLAAFFTSDAQVRAHAVNCLRYVSYGYIFYAWGMVTVQAFNGAGDTLTPTWLNLACQWILQIPLAWVLAYPAGLGATGVFLAMTLAESLLAVVGIWLFRRGSWKGAII